MKNRKTTAFASVILLLFIFSFSPKSVIATSSLDTDSITNETKSSKTTKKKHKKSKASKMKVDKTPLGEQDNISDQTDVSQQADSAKTKKKK